MNIIIMQRFMHYAAKKFPEWDAISGPPVPLRQRWAGTMPSQLYGKNSDCWPHHLPPSTIFELTPLMPFCSLQLIPNPQFFKSTLTNVITELIRPKVCFSCYLPDAIPNGVNAHPRLRLADTQNNAKQLKVPDAAMRNMLKIIRFFLLKKP